MCTINLAPFKSLNFNVQTWFINETSATGTAHNRQSTAIYNTCIAHTESEISEIM